MSIQKFLDDGTPFVKATYYEPGKTKVSGLWDVYIKADGVRVIRNKDGSVTSRNSKPLFNCNHLNFLDAEIFSVNWNTSVSLVRTESPTVVTQDMIYELTDGFVDPRLYLGKVRDPSSEKLLTLMQGQLDKGHEGLVIRKWNARKGIYDWLKVVPKLQADVRITGFKGGCSPRDYHLSTTPYRNHVDGVRECQIFDQGLIAGIFFLQDEFNVTVFFHLAQFNLTLDNLSPLFSNNSDVVCPQDIASADKAAESFASVS